MIPALAQALGVVLLLVFLAVSVAAQFRRLWASEDSAERLAPSNLPVLGKVALVAGLVLVGLCGGCRVALRFRPVEAVQNGDVR